MGDKDIDALTRMSVVDELQWVDRLELTHQQHLICLLYTSLVGINLLREGLDLPEVSLVAILDADKEGFLRSETSLIQTGFVRVFIKMAEYINRKTNFCL